MNEKMLTLTRELIDENPDYIGERLARMAKKLNSSRTDSNDIRSRAAKKMFSITSRDALGIHLKQTDALEQYLTILQGILLLTPQNPDAIRGILSSMSAMERVHHMQNNKYLDIAKDYILQALEESLKDQEIQVAILAMEKNLEKFQSDLRQNLTYTARHNKLISTLQKSDESSKDLRKQQAELIENIREGVEAQKYKIKEQSEQIELLQTASEDQACLIAGYQSQIQRVSDILESEDGKEAGADTSSNPINTYKELTKKIAVVENALSSQNSLNEQLREDLEHNRLVSEKHGNVANSALWISGAILLIFLIQLLF